MPDPLPRLHNQNAAVLGPMVTLASVECRDVAAVLSAVLVRELMNPVCLDRVQQLDSAGRYVCMVCVPTSPMSGDEGLTMRVCVSPGLRFFGWLLFWL